jgi:fatty-acyl-CoA synthase
MPETLTRTAKRVTRFLLKTRIVEQLELDKAPHALPVLLRDGLNVRTVHAIHARARPDGIAVVDEHNVLTFAGVDSAINRIARAFASIDVVRGDRVVVCMENRSEYFLHWFAGFRAGVAIVHASYRSTPDELRYLLEHSRAKAVVCSARTAPVVRELADSGMEFGVITVDDVAVLPDQHLYPDWTLPFPDDFFRAPKDARGDNVVYTSGTTGKPKGAVRNFFNHGIVELSRIGDHLPLRADDRHLVVSPLYHSAGQVFSAMMTSLGATVHLLGHFDAEETLAYLSRFRIHSVFMVPTMIRRILDLPAEVRARYPTPELRCLISGAAAFPHALRERAIEQFGPSTVYDFYGATELGWITLVDGHEMLERPGTIGRPLEGHELRVTDTDRNPLPPGEVGTIWVRNDQTMEGYLDDQRSTDETTDEEGWVTVDDLGYLDDDGYLYLAGRDRDMVITGGVNVYPVEIEEVVAHHPAVEEVAVIGLPDEEWGELLTGVVVGDASVESLDSYARERLASHKVPRRWLFVEELPRNPTGKVLKRELRERFAEA